MSEAHGEDDPIIQPLWPPGEPMRLRDFKAKVRSECSLPAQPDKDRCLFAPSSSYFLYGDAIPIAWVAEAWQAGGLKNDALEWARTIRKCGSFENTAFTRFVARGLTCEQVVELYVLLRENCARWETEWRPGFEEVFADSKGFLPDLDKSLVLDYFTGTVFNMVLFNDLQGLEAVALALEQEGLSIAQVAAPYADLEQIDSSVARLQPTNGKPADVWTPLLLAERMEHHAIAAALRRMGCHADQAAPINRPRD